MDTVYAAPQLISFSRRYEYPAVARKMALRNIGLFLQKAILFPFLNVFCDGFEVLGLDKLAMVTGPCLFVANHASHADTAIILQALPEDRRRQLAVAAAADYFYKNKFSGFFFSLFLNTFPFDRKHARRGFSDAKKVLKRGESLLIFPQGTRTNPAEDKPFTRGFALLASQLALPVVPIQIEGAYEMLPKGAKWPARTKVRIAFGEPVFPQECKTSEELARVLHNRVAALLEAA